MKRDIYETCEPNSVCRPCLNPGLNKPTTGRKEGRREGVGEEGERKKSEY